ncbi:MAG: winged helix-turn-helix domain-containing protein [Gammaproteobacteria bacterium]
MRILAVDEPSGIWVRLLKGLRELGYRLDVEQAGRCLALLSGGAYAVLLLALLSPSAWDLLDTLDDAPDRPGVLTFLEADDANAQARAGALVGAAQVITLPCSLTELVVRLPEPAWPGNGGRLQVGELELDLAHRRAWRRQHPVDLTRREFDLLALLAGHRGRALSRTWLMEQLWGRGDVALNALDVHVYRLREKLDRPFADPLLETVRGVGYRLNVPTADKP